MRTRFSTSAATRIVARPMARPRLGTERGVVRDRLHDPADQGVSQIARPLIVSSVGGYPYTPPCDRDRDRLRLLFHRQQDLAARRVALLDLDVAEDRIYLDRG